MITAHSLRHLWCSFQRSSCHSSLLHQFCVHAGVEDVEIVHKAFLQCRLDHSNPSWSIESSSSLSSVLLSFGMNEFTVFFFQRLYNIFVFFLEVCSLCHGACLKIWVATFHRDGVLVARPVVTKRRVRNVNRVGRDSSNICNKIHSILLPLGNCCISHRCVICPELRNNHASWHLSWRPLLSNDLLAMVALHVFPS